MGMHADERTIIQLLKKLRSMKTCFFIEDVSYKAICLVNMIRISEFVLHITPNMKRTLTS
jgi:hypothetical protein